MSARRRVSVTMDDPEGIIAGTLEHLQQYTCAGNSDIVREALECYIRVIEHAYDGALKSEFQGVTEQKYEARLRIGKHAEKHDPESAAHKVFRGRELKKIRERVFDLMREFVEDLTM